MGMGGGSGMVGMPTSRMHGAGLPFGIREGEVNREKYVEDAAQHADRAKLEHRKQLKVEQRHKETLAEANGKPLSAKDKERERSRRESAVTRKRTEIYTQQLEHWCRQLPITEAQLNEVRRTAENYRKELNRVKKMMEDQKAQADAAAAAAAAANVSSGMGTGGPMERG